MMRVTWRRILQTSHFKTPSLACFAVLCLSLAGFAGFAGFMSLHAEAKLTPQALRAARAAVKSESQDAPHDHASRRVPARIRVRLAEAAPKVEVSGFDLRIYDQDAGPSRHLASAPDQRSAWEIRCQSGRIRATNGNHTLDLHEPMTVETPAGFLQFRGRPYRDGVRIYSNGSLCEVVNEVSLEKYLDGLVNAEFSSKWSEEAVEAQVIAARTYAFYQMKQARRDQKNHFDVDATVRDQVYDGSYREDARASRMVRKTEGLVLTASNGNEPLKAFYHSTCGGSTELPERVWGSTYPGFKRTVHCPFCSASPVFHWTLDLQTQEISSALLMSARNEGAPKGWPANWARILQAGKLLDVRTHGSTSEGRNQQVITSWAVSSGGGKQVVDLPLPAARFRDWIGPAKLKSTSFNVLAHHAVNGDRWKFEGRGNGHGVGLCQWGAKTMGERGYKSAAILKLYYPDAVLRKMW